MDRRSWITAAFGGAAGLAALFSGNLFAQDANAPRERRLGNRQQRGERTMTRYENARFYNADGSFNEAAAKEAYVELFRFHRYTLAEVVDDPRFWMLDFGLGDFANVGMGGIFWVNDKEHGYFGHDIYLLPGQMIPEHGHFEGEGKPAKHEYWQVRNGSIYNFGQGGSKDDKFPIELPKSQLEANAITAFKCTELKAGTGEKSEAVLDKLGNYHFMIAGPEGAIVTEYASYHSGDGLRFQNKKAIMGNTPKK